MSTLLERMIQRTRAPLSSLEPLTGPRSWPTRPGEASRAGGGAELTQAGGAWPAAGDAEPGWGSPAAEVTDAADQPGVAAGPGQDRRPGGQPARRPGARMGQGRPRPADGQRADGLAAAGTEPPPDERGQPPALPRPALPRPALPRPALPEPALPGSAGRPEPRAAAAEHLDHDGDGPQADAAAHGRPAGRGVTDARGDGSRWPGAAAAAALTGTTASPAAAAAEPAAPATEPVAVSARLLPAAAPAQPPGEPHRPPAWRGPAADADSGRPQVTISIGHIEVRSAPPAERPRPRPPLRPQVSLADFLDQREGQRP
jgi:hypothetical protein